MDWKTLPEKQNPSVPEKAEDIPSSSNDEELMAQEDDRGRIERIWAERASQMARVEDQSDKQGERVTVALIRLGRELLGIEVQYVYDIRQVEVITRVPRVPGWVKGVTNLRGNILSVVDLRKYFGLPGSSLGGGANSGVNGEGENPGLLVVVQSHAAGQRNQGPVMEIVFLVDDVLGIETLPLQQTSAESGLIHRLKPEYIRAIAERKAAPLKDQNGEVITQRHIAILNAEALLSDPRIIIHEEVA